MYSKLLDANLKLAYPMQGGKQLWEFYDQIWGKADRTQRIFSEAGKVITPMRSCLNPENVEDQIMIKLNPELLKEMGKKKN